MATTLTGEVFAADSEQRPSLDMVQLRTAMPVQLVTLRRTGYPVHRSFPTTHATPKVLRVTRDAGETAARKGGEAR